jgi:hypothetical protein
MDLNRQADLHYAFQFGQDFVRTGEASVEQEFQSTFAGDAQAKAEFDRGVAHERARKARLS